MVYCSTVMVHNHNYHTTLSLNDLQELSMWENLQGIVACANDGLISSVYSNGVKNNEMLYLKYSEAPYNVDCTRPDDEVEADMIELALNEFVEGGNDEIWKDRLEQSMIWILELGNILL